MYDVQCTMYIVQFPPARLHGKYGSTLRKCIEILGWALTYHPDCKFFAENVDFSDMPADWKEVCDALGTPIIITSHDYSYTKRRRAYWTNIPIPENFTEGYSPKDPNDCLDPGRKVQKYYASGRMCVRPLGGSWQGDPEHPEAATNKPLLLIDEQHDAPQHVRPEEAEQLMGLPVGCTAGRGVSAKERLEGIGDGWDFRTTIMLNRYSSLCRRQITGPIYLPEDRNKIQTSCSGNVLSIEKALLNVC